MEQQVRLIKLCLNETYSIVHIGNYFSGEFPIQNCLKQYNVVLPLLFNFALEYDIRKTQENQMGLKLNWTRQLQVYADYVKLLRSNINITRKTLFDSN
jgi:hypothetical protein